MKKLIAVSLIAMMMTFSSVLVAQSTLVKVVIGELYKGSADLGYGMTAKEILDAIYDEARINHTTTYMPDKLAIQSVITGQYDALDLRISELEYDHSQSLVKVNIPLGNIDIYILSVGEKSDLSLKDLHDKNVVAVRGAIYVNKIKHYKNLSLATAEEAALMLTNGEADVWVAATQSYGLVKEKYPAIHVSSSPVSREYLYHYLHKDQSHLLKSLEASAEYVMKSKVIE
ncbi:transporter substrate-binding domain-containing protein [Vibrio pectenicida]|uniref:Transporter substrate-binding domain-containing protein n=1 Tax=Vibrio pectenicida TaxID=62763 RepID=A0A427U573_9VIBR|nr:transporter substrate-binding domain-containing protein [Vibrio pectenicida]NOH72634.1 transporter substrate-binding domain-containing protein [Vibrio pectenicida]RSD31819.1 transporter substrate-binding domain-containing protein [Vibrio pectenicida]